MSVLPFRPPQNPSKDPPYKRDGYYDARIDQLFRDAIRDLNELRGSSRTELPRD